jgi:Protein of unknown function (DUF3040)
MRILNPDLRWSGVVAAFRRWVVLSDHEQRVLDEIERRYADGARHPVRSGRAARPAARRSTRPPGRRVVLALASVCVGLFFAGVPAAALALALATAIGWLFWLLWSHRAGDRSFPAASVLGLAAHSEPRRPVGESFRQYLRWLSEAE